MTGPIAESERAWGRELSAELRELPGASLRSQSSIRLLPGVAASALHHCVAAEKATSGSRA
jgi:hypothetical protein